jgi:hypothetical protein
MGNVVKALIYMGLKRVKAIYQQSYPQKFWMLGKSFMNQGLSPTFTSSHQQSTPTWALA